MRNILLVLQLARKPLRKFAAPLILSATDANGGEGEDSLACDYSGPEIAVTFNARYIAEFLDVVAVGKVRAWIDSAKTTEWRPADDDTYRYLVMPLRN